MRDAVAPDAGAASSDGVRAMRTRLSWIWAQIAGRFWFRISIYALAALITALIARYGAVFVPRQVSDLVGEGSAYNLLSILASSMLVVATFSLGTMVQAYAAAASIATPRATRVLIEDPFSQNVLSTFLGAFVFSMVGIFAQSFGYYGQEGEVVMLVASGVVIVLVIAALFACVDHLANMVRLGETITKIATRAEEAMRLRAANPWLGGVELTADAQPTNWEVAAHETGFIRHIDMRALQKIAEDAGGVVRVAGLPGALADPMHALVQTSWEPGDEVEGLRNAFVLGPERSLADDPRYCVQVLAEIGSRALSPGINDPGTAIIIIATLQRLLTMWVRDMAPPEESPPHDRVLVPDLETGDLFEDAFGPLLRDASGMLEVGLRLQKTLAVLSVAGPEDYAHHARHLSQKALRHAREALQLDEDGDRLAEIAATVANPAANPER